MSNVAVSLPPSRMIGRIFLRSSPRSGEREQPFARAHPVDVAAQRVDLAVVRDVPVRVRERPRRERVRAEPLVHQRERRLEVRIRQIGEHRDDLIGNQHPLVDERLRRQARDVEGARVGTRRRQAIDRVLDALADDVQLALEARQRVGIGRIERGPAADEHLFEPRLGGHGRRAQQPIVGRHVPPAEQVLAFLADDPFEHAADLFAGRLRMREEDEAGAVAARRRQRDAERRGHLAQEAVRHLHEDAGAVAGCRLAAARAAVQQVDQDAQPLLDDRVRPAALDVDDEADAAGVVLVAGVVQTRSRAADRAVLREIRGSGPSLKGVESRVAITLGTPLTGGTEKPYL